MTVRKDADQSIKWKHSYGGILISMSLPSGSDGKDPAYNAGDLSLIPVSGRSPGDGNGNPVQYPCLENPWTEEPGGLQSM